LKEAVAAFFEAHFSLPVATLVLAALPILELRGALPFALAKGMPLIEAYALAVLGNMIPVPFILWFLRPATDFLRRWERGDRFVEWLFARTRRKSDKIQRYEAVGLAMFVAIPFPATGAWTGAMAAHILGLKFHRALFACFCGVCIAGVIVAALTLGVLEVLFRLL
jgi:uncharacterized membrane protein